MNQIKRNRNKIYDTNTTQVILVSSSLQLTSLNILFQNAVMNLTTLRIGGRATFSCEHGYKLLGAADIHCLSSGSWSGWPPGCVEVDCGQPLTVENSRMFLVNDSSTKYGALVEYLCFPGFTRDGPFQRRCEISGQWSGQDPVCYVASRLPAPTSSEPSNSLPRDGDNNVTGGNQDNDNGNIGVWIGVAPTRCICSGVVNRMPAAAVRPRRGARCPPRHLPGLFPGGKYRDSFSLNGSALNMRNPLPVTLTKQPKSWLKFAKSSPLFVSEGAVSILRFS